VALLVVGGKLKVKESLSARFGDIVSYFYLASAVIRAYEQKGEPQEEEVFMCWSLAFCLEKIAAGFADILQNFPKRFLGKMLWRLIFPYGNVYHSPRDVWSQRIAKLVQNDKPLRAKLTASCYVGEGQDAVAELEAVFQQCSEAEKFLQKLPGKGLQPDPIILQELKTLLQDKKISQDDFSALERFLQARRKVLDVDEFTSTRERYETTSQSSTIKQD